MSDKPVNEISDPKLKERFKVHTAQPGGEIKLRSITLSERVPERDEFDTLKLKLILKAICFL